jgi:Nuclease-related domain/UvrD-like helicase C-terminal domain/PhoH-like protein
MIPASIYAGCASPGEREIFRRLRDDPSTGGWFVLHSLDIAEHRKQVSGEADFVVIVPGKGVLCLEVKACSTLRRTPDGLWYYGIHPKGDARGPFKQASEAMHSIRKSLLKPRPNLGGIVFWSAVVFPYVAFTTSSGEWHPWQVIDRHAFTARPLSSSVEMILDHARAHLQAHTGGSWFNPALGEPSAEQCEAIARTLRPHFEFIESSKSHAERLGEELRRYTEEQYLALDAMEANPRVAFEGPAGTGKTMLAIEAARRGQASGRRVLLLCFNRLLGKWLEEAASALKPEVTTKTLHSYMLDVAGVDPGGAGNDPHFWETKLPCMALERLVETTRDDLYFDDLVVDEAQDILRDDYLDFLDISLKGGFASGRWRLFGDFEKQSIYASANLTIREVLDERASNVPLFSLRVNCRNPPRIAETARLLGGLDPSYKRILRPDNGIEPKIRYYKDSEEQQALLSETLDRLSKEGFTARDVVVLSTRSDAACAAQVNTHPWKGRLKPYATAVRSHTRYCSVHAFKGLEAPAIIVTDIDRISDPTSMAIFYVAITRAIDRLVLLVHESAREEIIQALI